MTTFGSDTPRLEATHLSHLRVVQFSGTDARAFLQTQLSSDLHLLQPDRPQFTAWCRPNGRIFTLGWLFEAGASLNWFVPSVNAESLVAKLSIYKLRAKAQISLLPDWVCSEGEFKLMDGRSLGYSDADVQSADASDAWILADIIQSWPTLGGNERFLPQMLGVERLGGLSLKKGCFPGQEVIARVHYKGEVKRTLARYIEIPRKYADSSASEAPADFELVQSAVDSKNFLNLLAVVKKPAPELINIEVQGRLRLLQHQVADSSPI